MKIVVVVQARMGSTRLPGKVMRPLAGAPLLQRLLERISAATTPFHLVVATSYDPLDNPIRDLCALMHVDCYSGHPTDLLDRHYQCAKVRGANIVVKIPSDCPLIDPQIIDAVLGQFLTPAGKFDYVSNLHPATYPDGNDVEVMSYSALEAAWNEADKNFEREHTTPFIWERPERFSIGNVAMPSGNDYSTTHRWTIDYEEDYNVINQIYDGLWEKTNPIFGLYDILHFLDTKPEIARINARYAGKNWYANHLHELKTISHNHIRKEFAA